ncbi:MAG: HD domain-containing protein [Enhydrobacter sp.]|nr:MAG: HD domain-containing protein [Enhydrobacter sp.]
MLNWLRRSSRNANLTRAGATAQFCERFFTSSGLIVFKGNDDVDQIAWRLLNSREMQRLRRIRQLGFSDLVYPGATHSRLAHSIGVYHTARNLVRLIEGQVEKIDAYRRQVVLLAALLHDVGHGPFSHAFEGATAKAGMGKDHEDWSADIILGDTEVHAILNAVDSKIADHIARLLKEEEPKDIFATIVSSQFDADRLDYLQRDRRMTGVQFGHLDQDWLFDCLRVGKVTVGTDDPFDADCLYLSPKGRRVAEEYIEARHRLYIMVYMHKTTRGAEKILEHLLRMFSTQIREGKIDSSNFPGSQLLKFFSTTNPELKAYLGLDDSVIWTELGRMADELDGEIAELAARLRNRCLYKCFDVAEKLGGKPPGNIRLRFKKALRDAGGISYLEDDYALSPYKAYDFDSPSALSKVLVKEHESDAQPTGIEILSPVIKTLTEREQFYRLYVSDAEQLAKLEKIWTGVTQ